MRLIDADELEKEIENAIALQKVVAEMFEIEDDESVVDCLKAVELINKYLNDEEKCCGNTYWTDKKGYSFRTDIGYFFDGLEAFENYLIERLKKTKSEVKQDEPID